MVLKYELEFLQIDEDTVAVPISGGWMNLTVFSRSTTLQGLF